MKAAVLPAAQVPVEILDVPVPSPGTGQVLVKIEACGICHSDVFLAAAPKMPKLPLILGHEAVGHVVELGSDVTTLRIGDRVGIAFLHHSCGHCAFCLSGRENYCPEQKQTG